MRVILDYIFDWLPFGFGVPILIGTAFVLLADEFKAFRAARVCFYLATAWIYGKVFMWAYFTSDRFQVRGVVAFLVFGFVGVGLIEALRLTSHREQPPQPREAVERPNTPNKPQALPSSKENQSQQNNKDAHGTTDKEEPKPQRHVTKEEAEAKPRNDRTKEHVPTADEIADALAKRLPQPAPAQPNSSVPAFKFHEEMPPDYYTIIFPPRTTLRLGREMLKKGWDGLASIDGERPFHIYEEEGDIYIDAKVYDEQGNLVLKLEKSTIKNSLPANWDVNYSDNAMEVVDAQQKPIFQMERDHPGFLRLNGRWYGKRGSYFGSPGTLKPLFKYPFRLHRGEYAQP